MFLLGASISDNSSRFKLLGRYGMKLHAFKLLCLLLCLALRSIVSLVRHVHLYPVHMGPSSRRRRKCSVFGKGDSQLSMYFCLIFLRFKMRQKQNEANKVPRKS